MKDHRFEFAVGKMSQVFKVSRSGYYDWIKSSPSTRTIENEKLTQMIHKIYEQSKGRYGSPKITSEIKAMGHHVSRLRVARIMRKLGIKSIIHRKYRHHTTDSSHKLNVSPNLLNREFSALFPGQKWVSDLNYIPTGQGWLYLMEIVALYDRRVIGWSLSKGMRASETVLPTWRMATRNRPIIAN